ncbi:GIN domain-containing protein [Phenylobacterium sp.]|uniref:GIN domain-containing protein n=1 Tax=Phenylobacterium sp. TaxID=1871053 RepID=UPI002731A184|nr:DUF2807 domain-containing protein [Phenylobacterium sp.]MDP1618020.1 DUF2807 domain-containing protein [Phenylobacterium sp.]MDP1987157.1 DUF2807 domain-containing protein [Phenylobacterium sp.]
MRRSMMISGLALAGLAMAGAAQAAQVSVKDAVARVVIVPEDRQDIRVDILHANPSLPLQVRTQDAEVIVDGDLDRNIRSCRTRGGRPSVTVSGVGEVAYDDMPQVVIRTPRDADVSVGGAVFGSVGRSQSLSFANAGCGDWTIANVAGKLSLSQAGSGDLRGGNAGETDLRVAGSGDLTLRQVRGPLKIDVAGSGDVKVAEVTGPLLQVRIAGAGDVHVAAGQVETFNATIAGSGDAKFGGESGAMQARIIGSGDVEARRVRGAIERSVIGSGAVTVDETP